MSMITRCPACETMFRVVPDQLRISAGWVRCGQCDEIFDASAHLLDGTPAVLSTEEIPTEVPSIVEAPVSTPSVTADQPGSVLSPVTDHLTEFSIPHPSDFQDIDLNFEEMSAEWEATVSPDEVALEGQGLPEVVKFDEALSVEPDFSTPNMEPDVAEKARPAATEVSPETISFLANDSQVQVSGRSARRWPLVVLSLLLLLGLISQGIYQERNSLVAWEPRLAPWLERACEVMGCSVGPVQQIDAISVESSTFTKQRADTYRLSFTLKNTATTAVAFPAIELTLTDALDRPFLRRVLRGEDMGSAETLLAAGSEWPAMIDIAVQSTAVTERVAGYRLVAFYP